MRINEDLAVSTSKILLVPYDSHHVERYHQWMQNEDLREATASDLLTLDEEYENQQSWRTAHDKLTFIVCQPAMITSSADAGEDDVEARMVGDVNLFLTPDDVDDDDDDNDEGAENNNNNNSEESERHVKGEIDIMIAAPEHRRKGSGEAAVRAFLRFLAANHRAILDEYGRGAGAPSAARDNGNLSAGGNGEIGATAAAVGTNYRLKRLVAKINADNKGSIRLFEKLGFRRDGDPNYFNEVSMVLSDFLSPVAGMAAGSGAGSGDEAGCLGYRECIYDRSRLKK
ncbi:acetyltransferase domain-containing protein [Ustulina deusta]|nr:acetyltransferase domain-containing protein [Ustulina deusta]